jgi:ADP-ribosylglycohydrolase
VIGAIAGDIIGSAYEFSPVKSMDFPLYTPQSVPTDDTVLTVAVADCIFNNKDYATTIKEYGRRYPVAGYGGMFLRWLRSDSTAPYNSYGNGSAMRVSPVGFAFSNMNEVLREAEKSAAVTHNHPEGIKGAQAIAAAVFMARSGNDKKTIRRYIETTFRYILSQTVDEIRHHYYFDETCPGSVPQAIIAFLESEDYEDAIRKAISLGGDADTLACMTGGIAQAYYTHIPTRIISETRSRLDTGLLEIVDSFNDRYSIAG